MLTLPLACVGIAASFPLGLLLALGRQSTLPVTRMVAIIYIVVFIDHDEILEEGIPRTVFY